jgi:hypothetical protein
MRTFEEVVETWKEVKWTGLSMDGLEQCFQLWQMMLAEDKQDMDRQRLEMEKAYHAWMRTSENAIQLSETHVCPEPTHVLDNTVLTFNDGHSCFTVEDSCYVLHNWSEGHWVRSVHLDAEAVAMLKDRLPDDADYALTFFNRPSGTL